MTNQIKLGIHIFLTAAVLDAFRINGHVYTDRNGDAASQGITQWLDNTKMSSNTKDFPQIMLSRPDGNEREHNVQNKPWQTFKESILQRQRALSNVQFVKMSREDIMDAHRSLAVLQASHTEGRVHTGILSLVAAVMLVVVLVICIHAPCTCLWRRRHRSDLEVDLISCPNPTAHDGKCGKCLYDKVTRKRASKFGFSKRPFSSPASIATINKEELYMPYENQPPWVTSSNKGQPSTLPNPKKSRSIVQAILKRSRDRDKFRYEFLASRYGYNYKQFRDSYKRSSVYDEQDPNWYSAGEFLNNQSNRGQKNYGSTDAGKLGGASTCCKWSRGQQQPTNQSVEDIIKLQPRRRQIVELQEFPVGYSGTYAGVDGACRDNELFDPYHDPQPCCYNSAVRTGSETNVDMYFTQLDNNNHVTDLEKAYKSPQPPSPNPSVNIAQDFPPQFDPTLVPKEGEKKRGKGTKKDWEEDEDSDLYETSSDDLLSFDEWDAALERRQRRSQEFLYSPHMQDSRQHCHHLHHSYPAVLRYPDIPRDTRSLPREYKTRMRRHVARSENELRRSSGYFGQSSSHNAQNTGCHSSSDTSLHRMQIEKELTAAGLKAKQRKRQKEPSVRIRDNRLDPLAGIMSPVRPLKDVNQQSKNTDHNKQKYLRKNTDNRPSSATSDLKSLGKWENDLKVCLKDDSYVVKLPSLDCKQSVLHEHEDEEALTKGDQEFYKENLEKKLNNEKPETHHNRVHLELDPHYIKNSYLREEPVRDTDSDDGERMNRSTEISTGTNSQTSINRDDTFSSSRSTRL